MLEPMGTIKTVSEILDKAKNDKDYEFGLIWNWEKTCYECGSAVWEEDDEYSFVGNYEDYIEFSKHYDVWGNNMPDEKLKLNRYHINWVTKKRIPYFYYIETDDNPNFECEECKNIEKNKNVDLDVVNKLKEEYLKQRRLLSIKSASEVIEYIEKNNIDVDVALDKECPEDIYFFQFISPFNSLNDGYVNFYVDTYNEKAKVSNLFNIETRFYSAFILYDGQQFTEVSEEEQNLNIGYLYDKNGFM